jgi:transposase
MNTRRVAKEFRIPDALWERMELLLPVYEPSPLGGRPRLDWRPVIDGIFYVLRTGCQWKAVPPEFGSGSSLHRYFQELVRSGVFEDLWAMALFEYDDLKGLEWKWQSMDGAMTKAPLGGEKYWAQSDRSGEIGDQTQRAYRRTGRTHRRHGQRREHARQVAR